MCKRCHEKRLEVDRRNQLTQRRNTVTRELTQLLYVDSIKGSEYKRLLDMNSSSDLENLLLVEEIIKVKLG